MDEKKGNLGTILKQQRVMVPLTLQELAKASSVSPSHLGRIERGERYPSAKMLRKIARPLGFNEDELFTLAGFLSPQEGVSEDKPTYLARQLDPYVARVLSEEPLEVQRSVIGILSLLKSVARGMNKPDASGSSGTSGFPLERESTTAKANTRNRLTGVASIP